MPGIVYGFSVMEVTGLPSGTVYPAHAPAGARRPDPLAMGAAIHRRTPRCARRGNTTSSPARAARSSKRRLQRYPLLAKLLPSPEVEDA